MIRRIVATAALAACAGLYAAAAERATFVLTNGDRAAGELTASGADNANFVNGQLTLAENGQQQSFPIDQVAVIDLVGGAPAPIELSRAPENGQALVLRNGHSEAGRFVNIVRGDTVLWDKAGQQEQFPLSSVARIYLNSAAARTAYNTNGRAITVGTSGQAATTGGRTISVDARQGWVDTGIDVNSGDKVAFQASGEVTFGRSAGQTAGPDGNGNYRAANYPFPSAPVGALIGRIGPKGTTFGIGSQTQRLPMPAAGRLYLGVNDNEVTDNSGGFSVVIAKQ